MLESSMIKALTVNALLTFYGLNAAELYSICERTISPTSQTIKPTIQVYKTCLSSVLKRKQWTEPNKLKKTSKKTPTILINESEFNK